MTLAALKRHAYRPLSYISPNISQPRLNRHNRFLTLPSLNSPQTISTLHQAGSVSRGGLNLSQSADAVSSEMEVTREPGTINMKPDNLPRSSRYQRSVGTSNRAQSGDHSSSELITTVTEKLAEASIREPTILNPAAVAFIPAKPAHRRGERVPKRFQPANQVASQGQAQDGSLKKAESLAATQRPAEKTLTLASRNVPQLKPSVKYLEQCERATYSLNSSQPILVILDLNGTLLFRKRPGKKGLGSTTPRPHLDSFLEWLLKDSIHAAMIWSSVRPGNLKRMIGKAIKPEYAAQLVATWGRDTLRLSREAYNDKVQVYKQLGWIWADGTIQKRYPREKGMAAGIPVELQKWGQHNTILIDDSTEKAVTQPHNHIHVPEFVLQESKGLIDEERANVLGQVKLLIERASRVGDVSNFLLHNKPMVASFNPRTRA